MSLYSTTRDELVERICRVGLGEWWAGTTTAAGSTTTLVDSSRGEEDDFFNNLESWVYLRSGTYKGAEKKVSDWALSGTTLTFGPATGAAPGSGILYSIHSPQWKRSTIHSVINMAIDEANAQKNFVEMIDETNVTLAAGVYEYNVPAGFMYIYRITMADVNGDFTNEPIPPHQYRIVRGSGIPKIQFIKTPDDMKTYDLGNDSNYYTGLWGESELTDSRALRIEGLGKHAHLTLDTDACTVSPNFVVAFASAWLLANSANEKDYTERYKTMARMVELERPKAFTKFPPDSKRVF